MAAKIDLFRVKQEHAKKEDDDDRIYIDRGSPDPEARLGRTSKKKGFSGWKVSSRLLKNSFSAVKWEEIPFSGLLATPKGQDGVGGGVLGGPAPWPPPLTALLQQPLRVEAADSELIVPVAATPSKVHDGSMLPELIDARPREAMADKADDRPGNHAYLASAGVSVGITRRHQRPGRPRPARKERPQIERKFAACKSCPRRHRARP